MKTIPEVLALIDNKISNSKKEVDKTVEQLVMLKSKANGPITNEMKHELMRCATAIAEHKGIIATLDTLYKEIQE